MGFEFEFAHDRECDLNVCGWLIVLASVIVFWEGFFMASAILPFVLYSSTMKSGILYAFIHIASPIPSFHEVMMMIFLIPIPSFFPWKK